MDGRMEGCMDGQTEGGRGLHVTYCMYDAELRSWNVNYSAMKTPSQHST